MLRRSPWSGPLQFVANKDMFLLMPAFLPRILFCAGFLMAAFAHQAQAQLRWDSDDRDTQTRNVAGEFDYYALVLSWSPTHCATPEGQDDNLQCNRHDGRRYAFILHGLWPQYEKGYPEFCRTRRRPFVPQPLIDSMLDIMPSPKLVIHEYRKHGTCSGLDPAGYYQVSRQLFSSIRIPERYVNPFETQYLSPRELQRDFIVANPQLRPDMIAVSCARGARGRLREIRICFSKDGKPRSCGSNENQRRLCSIDDMAVPPVRSTKRDPNTGFFGGSSSSSPLPGPR